MDHVGLVHSVAFLDYVCGHFELEPSDMIFTPFSRTGPLDPQEEDDDRMVASSGELLGPVIEQPLGSYFRRQTWR